MQVKIIATGSSRWERLIRRWGVSILIGEDVLFDTFGDPGVLLGNMRKFNIDPAKIKHIVLSHDDWDHISGLWHLIQNRTGVTVYICPGFRQEIKDRIALSGVKVVEAAVATQIKSGIYSTGELCATLNGREIYEQSVVIRIGGNLALICGCAHPGVANIVKQVKGIFKANVCWLIGGFHLKDNTDEANARIIRDLHGLGVTRVAPMHCTGRRATNALGKEFNRGFTHVREGCNIILTGG